MNRSDSLYAMQEKEKTIGSEERGLTYGKDEVRAPIHLKRGSSHIIPDPHNGDKGCHRKERTDFGIVPNAEQLKQESNRSWKCGLLLFGAFYYMNLGKRKIGKWGNHERAANKLLDFSREKN